MKKKDLYKQIISMQRDIDNLNIMVEILKQSVDRLYGDTIIRQPYISTPDFYMYDSCPDGTPHNFPTPWLGITPPHCTKCGKPGIKIEVTC